MRQNNIFSGFLMRASAASAIFMAAMVVSDVKLALEAKGVSQVVRIGVLVITVFTAQYFLRIFLEVREHYEEERGVVWEIYRE